MERFNSSQRICTFHKHWPNIPVEHIFYANTPAKYHFLFDYYVGKITQTGLHSVHALNLMCILSLSFLLLMIFQFGRTVFKNDAVGILGALFLLFHSSISGLKWGCRKLGLGYIQENV